MNGVRVEGWLRTLNGWLGGLRINWSGLLRGQSNHHFFDLRGCELCPAAKLKRTLQERKRLLLPACGGIYLCKPDQCWSIVRVPRPAAFERRLCLGERAKFQIRHAQRIKSRGVRATCIDRSRQIPLGGSKIRHTKFFQTRLPAHGRHFV